jgi:hypothetical protein
MRKPTSSEFFQFVLTRRLPADNNLAERSIRPVVIVRKVSGSTRRKERTKMWLTLAKTTCIR